MKTGFLAGESKSFSLQGGRFYFVSGDAEIHAKLKAGGDTRVYKLYQGQGVDFDGGRFAGVEIINGEVPQEIEFEVYDKEVFDNRIPGILEFREIVSPEATSSIDKTLTRDSTDVIAADFARKKLVVYALPTNSDYIRVGPGAGENSGYPLPPGGSIDYKGTFSVNVFNASLENQKYGWYSEGE